MRFWDASGVSLKPLYKLGTAGIFQTDCEHNDSLNQAGEEEWPPFRKVTSRGDTGAGGGGDAAVPGTPVPRGGDAPAGAIPAAPWGRVPSLGAQLLPRGHKGRLFCTPRPVGLPWCCGGGSQGTGDAWGRSWPRARCPVLVAAHGCVTPPAPLPAGGLL